MPPRAERGARQPKELSFRQHANLFFAGVKLFNSPQIEAYDEVARQNLLQSTTNHALNLLKAPEWRLKGMHYVLDRKLGVNTNERNDANRIIDIAAGVIADAAIKVPNGTDPIHVAKWHEYVLKEFGLEAKKPAEPITRRSDKVLAA